MAANRGWRVKQMDITTAFLNGIILEELYMLQPEGLDDGSSRVCRLKKAIYGLKQAPRAWYHKLEETLLAGGFKKSECDHSLFLLQEKEQFLMLLVYVDDILLFSESSAMIEHVEEMLEMQFKCSKMGDVKYYLGMHVERDLDKGVLRLHQRKYCEGLAEKYGLQDRGKPATPLPSGFTVEPCADEEVVGESDRKLFHSMVGALNYAANHTRPDIAFATSRLASVVSRPSHEQLEAAKRLVRYVTATASVGLEYSAVRQRLQRGAADLSKGEMLLTCYTDASFNSVKADGTSIGGYVCLFGGGAVSWRSKKQNEVGQSSCETEYMALHHGAKEVVWLRRLLEEIGVGQREPTVIFCDNESAVKLAKNASAACYIDDVLIYGSSEEQHVQDLKQTFEAIAAAGLTCHPDKCKIARHTVAYLGFEVRDGRLAIQEAKVKVLENLAAPKDKTGLRALLGLLNYYRKFVPNFSRHAYVLNQLLRERRSWQWGELEEAARQDLLEAVRTSTLLQIPRAEAPFILYTDWSSMGMGAVLCQEIEGEERVIAFASRSCSPSEANYCSYEGEGLTAVWGITHFKVYLQGRHFTLVTDHQPLLWLMTKQELTGRNARWAIKLLGFDFEIRHRPGKTLQHADGLSKNPPPMQPKQLQLRTSKGWRVVPQPQERDMIMGKMHAKLGHYGITRTRQLLSTMYWWASVGKDVAGLVANCEACQRNKARLEKERDELHSLPIRGLGYRWSLDLTGELLLSKGGKQYILVMV
ncbi:unnamed protein product [Closterium sp. NIES-53]